MSPFSLISNWWRGRAESRAAENAHATGYKWATDSLLRGVDADTLAAKCDWMPPIAFDRGVMQAIADWQKSRGVGQ